MPDPIWTDEGYEKYAEKMFVSGFWLGFFLAVSGFTVAYLLFWSR